MTCHLSVHRCNSIDLYDTLIAEVATFKYVYKLVCMFCYESWLLKNSLIYFVLNNNKKLLEGGRALNFLRNSTVSEILRAAKTISRLKKASLPSPSFHSVNFVCLGRSQFYNCYNLFVILIFFTYSLIFLYNYRFCGLYFPYLVYNFRAVFIFNRTCPFQLKFWGICDSVAYMWFEFIFSI